jgi:hypothetical protein
VIRSATLFGTLCLIGAASTSSAQNVTTEIPQWRSSDWMNALIVNDDWIVIGASRNDDSVHLINKRFYLSEKGNPVVFIRIEESVPQTLAYLKYFTVRETVEVDCPHHKLRELEETLFSGRNLDGVLLSRHVTGKAGEWSYPSPDSMGAAQLQAACTWADKAGKVSR